MTLTQPAGMRLPATTAAVVVTEQWLVMRTPISRTMMQQQVVWLQVRVKRIRMT
jgi:hypothetical protein